MIAIPKRHAREGFPTKPVMETRSQMVNVGPTERWISLLAGTALAAAGLARRSVGGLLTALSGGYLIYRGQRGYCSMYQMMGQEEVAEPPLEIREQMTVACGREQAYQFCKDTGKLACTIAPETELTTSASGHWLWKWQSRWGMTFNCEVELAEDRRNELLAWRTLPSDANQVIAELHFIDAPSDRGTEMHLRLEMVPRGGLIGHAIGGMLKPVLAMMLREHLRRVKSLIEVGEIATNAMRTEHPVPSAEKPMKTSEPMKARERKPLPAEIPSRGNGVDPVDEASMESFPASDAPGRI